jgi:hypothetical protein
MNKKSITKALLSATILASGVVGAGSVIAQASDADTATISVIAPSEQPNAFQTIDDQPDEVDTTDQTTDDAGDRRDRGCGGNEAVAEALGLTTDELHEARDAGSTLADIAAAQGVDVDDVVQAIVDGKTERLDEKVAAGELTADEARAVLADAEDRATTKVNAS